jgi:hypothetical protein
MPKIPAFCGAAVLCFALSVTHAQSVDSSTEKLTHFPTRLFSKLQSKFNGINKQLAVQTQHYVMKMERREGRLRQRLMKTDSVGARQLFAGSAQSYAALLQKLKTDTGGRRQIISGQYQPYVDSLQGELKFLSKNPQFLGSADASLQGSMKEMQAMQAKLMDADQAKLFIQERRQQIGQYLAQHNNLQGVTASYINGINQDAYYYSQQIKQYRDLLNDPDRLEQKALAMVSRLPAYQAFMKSNSLLSGLFKAPGGDGMVQALPGLQTHGQIAQQVQSQISAGGGGGEGMSSLQNKVQTAQSQLDGYKAKLGQLGAGSTAADAADFRPNDQKTKSLWHRLEYGVNFQATHSNFYYPTMTEFGLSLGYRLGHSNVVGIGASYKMGWGSDIQHIAITGQGVGLRSFLQIAIKNGLSATGGFEYNYTTPFTSYQQLKQLQYWTKSGLIGLSKTVSMKSRVLKKTQLQLLWDFLSYQQVPKTQTLLFRIGYGF